MIMVLLSLFGGSLFSQTKQKMAIVSFTGRGLSDDETGALMDLFTDELTRSEYRNDFTLLARNDRALRTAFGELNFQRNASLDQNQMGQLGKQLGAGWVFYGTVSSFGGSSITINILDVETSQIIATVNRRFSSVYDVANGNSAGDMTKELIAKARGQNISRSRTSSRSSSGGVDSDLQRQINSVTTVRNVGRGLWITGVSLVGVGTIAGLIFGDPFIGFGGGFVVGLPFLLSGIPVDIVYSTKKKNLEAQLSYSFLPIIAPEMDLNGQFNGNLNMGAQFVFSYKF